MRASTAAQLLLGTALMVAGFCVLTDAPLTHSEAGLFDMKDRQCRYAPVAVGSSCPADCVARPIGSSEGRATPPECHSPLWIATCGKACAPASGYARLPDGGLIDGRRLIVTLHLEPNDALRGELSVMGVRLTPRFDGLDRYDADVSGGKIEKIKKRLSALPQVASVEYVLR